MNAHDSIAICSVMVVMLHVMAFSLLFSTCRPTVSQQNTRGIINMTLYTHDIAINAEQCDVVDTKEENTVAVDHTVQLSNQGTTCQLAISYIK